MWVFFSFCSHDLYLTVLNVRIVASRRRLIVYSRNISAAIVSFIHATFYSTLRLSWTVYRLWTVCFSNESSDPSTRVPVCIVRTSFAQVLHGTHWDEFFRLYNVNRWKQYCEKKNFICQTHRCTTTTTRRLYHIAVYRVINEMNVMCYSIIILGICHVIQYYVGTMFLLFIRLFY